MSQASLSLPPASAQEIFDIVARHLLTQRKRSINDTSMGDFPICLYRGPNGLKCAVGVLIPDEVYRPSLEGIKCTHLPGREPKLDWMSPHMDLLIDLQRLHDCNSVESWHQQLDVIAQHAGLSPAVLEEFPE